MVVVKRFHKAEQPAALVRFLSANRSREVLAFNVAAAEIAGRIYWDLERVGQPIRRADVMIADIALSHSLRLITANQHHHERIRSGGYAELKLGNWREPLIP